MMEVHDIAEVTMPSPVVCGIAVCGGDDPEECALASRTCQTYKMKEDASDVRTGLK